MFDLILHPIDSLNRVRLNVWSVFLILVGAVLVLHGHADTGGALLTGGFALLRTETVQEKNNQSAEPNTDKK